MASAMRSARMARRNGPAAGRAKLMNTVRWSCRLRPTGRSTTDAMSTPRRCSAGPMPESIRSWGVLKVPAQRIPSPAASARMTWPFCTHSTPTACVPRRKSGAKSTPMAGPSKAAVAILGIVM